MRDPTTWYVEGDGAYVIVNNSAGGVVQISNKNDTTWIRPF